MMIISSAKWNTYLYTICTNMRERWNEKYWIFFSNTHALQKCLDKMHACFKLNFNSLHLATKSLTKKLLLLSVLTIAHNISIMSCSEKTTIVCSDILTGWLCCVMLSFLKILRRNQEFGLVKSFSFHVFSWVFWQTKIL